VLTIPRFDLSRLQRISTFQIFELVFRHSQSRLLCRPLYLHHVMI